MIEYPARGWETMDTTSQRATQIPCLNAHIDEENNPSQISGLHLNGMKV